MNCAIIVKHVRPPIFLSGEKRLSSRKFIEISEIKDADTIRDVFTWNATTDTFQNSLSESYLLKRIADNFDISIEKVLFDFERRRRTLLNMVEHNVRDYHSVNNILSKYYSNPENQ